MDIEDTEEITPQEILSYLKMKKKRSAYMKQFWINNLKDSVDLSDEEREKRRQKRAVRNEKSKLYYRRKKAEIEELRKQQILSHKE